MGAIANGITYHGGLRPFVATFFVFSDYMRPAVRLAALNELPVIFVWTHDSIGLGEDGPTHQPIEQLMSLRAMPLLHVVRPGDAAEAAEGQDLRDPEPLDFLAIAGHCLQHRPGADRALLDPTGQKAAQIRVSLQRCRQHPERLGYIGDLARRRYMAQDQLEQWIQPDARRLEAGCCPPRASRGIQRRKIELVVVGAQIGEHVEHLIQCPVRLGVRLVHLVQHHDRPQPQHQCFCGDELGLRHRPLGGIDQ